MTIQLDACMFLLSSSVRYRLDVAARGKENHHLLSAFVYIIPVGMTQAITNQSQVDPTFVWIDIDIFFYQCDN